MRIVVLLISLLLFIKSPAQANALSLSFQLSLPQADYKKTYPKTGTGLLFDIVHYLSANRSVGIGGDLGLLQVNNADNSFTGYYRNQYHTYFVSLTNYIFSIAPTFAVNLVTFKNSTKVFLDFTIGTNIFLAYSAISHNVYNPVNDITTGDPYSLKIDSSFSHIDYAVRIGSGAGMEAPLGKNRKISLMFKFSYLYGSNAKYFSHPGIQNLQITLIPKESKTSILLLETGIRYRMFKNKMK